MALSGSYAVKAAKRRLPASLERRHVTHRHQCLCQFVEDFVTSYLACLHPTGDRHADVNKLVGVFRHYLNCSFDPNPATMEELGYATAAYA